MAETTVKFVDVSESVLISDLLYFAWNKLKSTPTSVVASLCHTFYTDDDYVYNEKLKLYKSLGLEYCPARRSDSKRLNNIEDICATILRQDSQKEFQITLLRSMEMRGVFQLISQRTEGRS